MMHSTEDMDSLLLKKFNKIAIVMMILYPTSLYSERLECEVPQFLDNCFLEMPNRYINGTVTYHCDKGYWFTGTKTRVCQQNLTWSGNPGVCLEVRCPALLDPPNGRIEAAGRKFNDKALVTCNKGYTFSRRQDNPGICQENNTWSFKGGTCKKIKCPDLPDPPHGKVVYRGDGYKATTICNRGYRYSQPDSVTRWCRHNNTWSPQSGSCEEVRCPDIENLPWHGKIVYNGYNYKARATVVCDVGYKYTKPESMTRTCQGDNTWSLQSDGECKEIPRFCPEIPSIGNAISFSNGLHYGSIVTYKCKDGYKLTGRRDIQCENNRQWSTPPVQCVRDKQDNSLKIAIPCSIIFVMTVLVGGALWLNRETLRRKCSCPHDICQIEDPDQQSLTTSTSVNSELANLQRCVKQFADENMNKRTLLVAAPQQVVVTNHCVLVPRDTDT